VGHNVTHKLAPNTLPLPLRRSPPWGFLFTEHSLLSSLLHHHNNAAAAAAGGGGGSVGSGGGGGGVKKSIRELAAALRAFADVSVCDMEWGVDE
jgi:hypothetical protein